MATLPPGAAGGTQIPQPAGPPYLPSVAMLGGMPTVELDDPICAVLIFLFVVAAVVHMTIFQVNLRREHKFVFSALLFGFCIARITALSMRVAWASYPTNLNVAIAANIFVAAGVLLLYIVNLIFAQRIVRSYHPHFGWHPLVSWAFHSVVVVVGCLLVMVITATVHSFFTLDAAARQSDRTVQLFASTFLAVLAFLPIPIVIAAAALPRRQPRPEKFGRGRLRSKLALVLTTSALLALGAGFRTGVAFDVRPITQPAWFHHKAAYYTVNYAVELAVVYMYMAARFDRRFHVHDGSSAPGHYSGGGGALAAEPGSLAAVQRINSEGDVFGPTEEGDFADGAGNDVSSASNGGFGHSVPTSRDREKEWESRAREELEKRASLDDRRHGGV